MKALRYGCYALVLAALAWSIAVTLNGSVMANKILLVAWSDAQAALALNVLALVAIGTLALTSKRTH